MRALSLSLSLYEIKDQLIFDACVRIHSRDLVFWKSEINESGKRRTVFAAGKGNVEILFTILLDRALDLCESVLKQKLVFGHLLHSPFI